MAPTVEPKEIRTGLKSMHDISMVTLRVSSEKLQETGSVCRLDGRPGHELPHHDRRSEPLRLMLKTLPVSPVFSS